MKHNTNPPEHLKSVRALSAVHVSNIVSLLKSLTLNLLPTGICALLPWSKMQTHFELVAF